MSPEQAKGEALDGRSDLYSLGMLMYEMVTGATPYRSIPKTAILGKLLYEPVDPPLEFPPNLPPFVQRLISDLLKKDPRQRTADAGLLSRQLSDILRFLVVSEDSLDTAPTVIVTPSRNPQSSAAARPLAPDAIRSTRSRLLLTGP